MTSQPNASSLPNRWVNLALVAVLAALAGIAILPAYLNGQWPWVNSPQVAQIEQLRALQTEGLALPGWRQTTVEPVLINRQTWTLVEYRADAPETQAAPVQQFALLLHPQPWHSNQPQLEWIDLAGAQNWRIESRRRLKVTSPGTEPVTARFFRAWGDGRRPTPGHRQSFAVVQWYAMPHGGQTSPGDWFWANQWSQLTQRQLTPWVAVCLLLPTPPLGAIDDFQPLAAELTGQIQQQLTATVLN
ncbi:cyanoexosortase B system-associated protein [Nodosilinea sp. PGN35]|uniref:cyanoexosortase B system-associated protein n=1 Tax=Nodosilinea sp. PGN35 TaxID=3020489 RepID=UPI0023B34CA4|nr:cyanoexosortase B system-associated protein [Nodosilinea sp. TSF1-S3]MDF0368763.1 cyanoexosortase B system-associated protein [Nodosilinea sp. TSF1-S3]